MVVRYVTCEKCPHCKKEIQSKTSFSAIGNGSFNFFSGYGSPYVICPYCEKEFYVLGIGEAGLFFSAEDVPEKYEYEYKQSMARLVSSGYKRMLIDNGYATFFLTSKFFDASLKNKIGQALATIYTKDEENQILTDARQAQIRYIPDHNYPEEYRIAQFISATAKDLINASEFREMLGKNDLQSAIKNYRESVFDKVVEKYNGINGFNEYKCSSVVTAIDTAKRFSTRRIFSDYARETIQLHEKIAREGNGDLIVRNGPTFANTYQIIRYTLWSEKMKSFLALDTHEGRVYKYFLKLLNALEQECIDVLKQEKKKIEEQSSAPGPDVKNNYFSEMRELKALFDDGIITEEEFIAKKKLLLGI